MLYVELVINTTVHVSTGDMHFMLVYGTEAKLPIDLALGTSSDIASLKFAHRFIELVKQDHEIMSKA